MEDKCINPSVCDERFKNFYKDLQEFKILQDKSLQEIKLSQEKYDTRLMDAEKNIDKLNNTLTIKFVQLEAKFDMNTKMTADKIDSIAKDIKDLKMNSNKEDSFKQWLQKIGTKFLEVGLYAGVMYAVLTNLLK